MATELAMGGTTGPGVWFVAQSDRDAPVVEGRTGPGQRRTRSRAGMAGGDRGSRPDEVVREVELTLLDVDGRPRAGRDHALRAAGRRSEATTDEQGASRHRVPTLDGATLVVDGQTYVLPGSGATVPRVVDTFVVDDATAAERPVPLTTVTVRLDGAGVVTEIDPPYADIRDLSELATYMTWWLEQDAAPGSSRWRRFACSMIRQTCYSLRDVTDPPAKASDEFVRLALQQVPVEFVYMDCGRWGGDGGRDRHFGLVWRNVAGLCAFRTVGATGSPPAPPAGSPWTAWMSKPFAKARLRSPAAPARQTGVPKLDAVVRGLAGGPYRVDVIGVMASYGLLSQQVADTGVVTIILPDLHLPVGSPPGNPKGIVPNDGRVYANPWPPAMPTLAQLPGAEVFTEERWAELYRASVIFGAGERPTGAPVGSAAGDLLEFLDRLTGLARAGHPLHFVQLGDLYELWTGLDWFCVATPPHREVVELSPGRPGGRTAAECVATWAANIRGQFPRLVDQLERTGREFASTFLAGNHDQYLIRSDCRPAWMAPRWPESRQNGVYVEHGHNHQADPYNRDGSPLGHEGATKYFFDHNVVHLAPRQRRLHLASAVRQFCERPDFGVYVMGHTHNAFLTRVRVVVVAPTGGPAAAGPNTADLSGDAWLDRHGSRFRDSVSLDDLAPAFRAAVRAFTDALSVAGAEWQVHATRRYETRAYLCQFSMAVARGRIRPGRVPPHPSVPIRWDHGDIRASRRAAAAMADRLCAGADDATTSNRLRGLAVDLSIVWQRPLTVLDAAGARRTIRTFPLSHLNAKLHRVGETYGVRKSNKTEIHWSADGT